MPTPRLPPAPHVWSALACALAGAALFQFFGNAGRGYIDTASLFHWWGYQWLNPASETEHGWVILAVSVWLLWRQRRPLEPDAGFPLAAVAALAVALLLHAAGFAAQQARISIVALLVYTWGVIRLAGGPRWGAAAVFPLAFMGFALPVGVLDEVGLPLRLWVTDAGEVIARAAGIPVLRSGTQLLSPDGRFNYDVAAPCSGVRSLMALTALSLLFGYLNFRSAWRRGLVFALAFPLVYLGNVARIVAIVFAAQWAGPVWGARAHEVMGYGVFVIVLGGVLAAIAALRRWWPESTPPGREVEPAVPSRRDPAGSTWSVGSTLAAGAMLGLVGVEMTFLHRLAHLPARGGAGVALAADGVNPVELPAFIGTDWIGQRVEVTAVEREILPPDTGYSRRLYVNLADRSRDVFLSIVLSGRDRTSIHRPELCLVGQGWSIEGATRHAFRHPNGGAAGGFDATLLRVRRERPSAQGRVVVPQLVAYWFVSGDTVTASHWGRFGLDAWNRVARARVDRWAYVLMQTDVVDGEPAALARMQAVLDGTLPAFQRVTGRAADRR
ncbi:MAG: exosortase [Opitutaceae bacterium]|nr:exosortase [Opitutaceae bacterium]